MEMQPDPPPACPNVESARPGQRGPGSPMLTLARPRLVSVRVRVTAPAHVSWPAWLPHGQGRKPVVCASDVPRG